MICSSNLKFKQRNFCYTYSFARPRLRNRDLPDSKNPNIVILSQKVTILIKSSVFTNFFLKKSVAELIKHFVINKHLINLETDKQPPYGLIYNI